MSKKDYSDLFQNLKYEFAPDSSFHGRITYGMTKDKVQTVLDEHGYKPWSSIEKELRYELRHAVRNPNQLNNVIYRIKKYMMKTIPHKFAGDPSAAFHESKLESQKEQWKKAPRPHQWQEMSKEADMPKHDSVMAAGMLMKIMSNLKTQMVKKPSVSVKRDLWLATYFAALGEKMKLVEALNMADVVVNNFEERFTEITEL